jgi:hypothetical protein
MSEPSTSERPKMRQGMPLEERQRLRAWILESALDQARRQAAEVYLSMRCRSHLLQNSPGMSYDQRRLEHTKCKGESMGDGCLCEWHDPDEEPT